MKCLVTGAAGFIGWHLTQRLKNEGHDVIGIDNFYHPSEAPKVEESVYADVRYVDDIDKFVQWADVVFHLAAQIHVDRSIHSPVETVDINITGTLNILELCRKYDKKMIFASSSEVYGTSQSEYITEDHPLDAQSPYAASKVAGDRLCKSYFDTYGMNIVILRNFNTFGPYQTSTSYGSVIAIFTRNALQGLPLVIYGSGEQERDYMYVDDAVEAYIRCLGLPAGTVVNAGTGKTISIRELAIMVLEITKSESKIKHVDPRAGEVQRLCAGIDKFKSYGFKPETVFEKNLKKYIEIMRSKYEKM